MRLILLAFVLQTTLSITTQAQDETVSGNLTVTQSLKAGTSGSAGGFELRPNGILISKGVYSSTAQDLLSTDQGAGTRFLWYPGKGAFRAGYVSGSQWSEANIGNYSTALGSGTMASGSGSTAMGAGTTASEYGSTAMGVWTTASEYGSTAMGDGTVASGWSSTVMGSATTASGDYSTAIGEHVRAESYASLAIGSYNVGGGSAYDPVPEDPVFEIGNGTAFEDENQNWVEVRSNALTVYRNGDMDVSGNINAQGVVTCAPGGDIPMFNPAP